MKYEMVTDGEWWSIKRKGWFFTRYHDRFVDNIWWSATECLFTRRCLMPKEEAEKIRDRLKMVGLWK